MVESCSVTAADCPCRFFPYIERTGQGLRPAVGGLFSFRQYYSAEGLCYPLAALFFFSAKDTFEKPSATRWTEIFQNFFCLSNPGTGILATGGQKIFLSLPTTPAKAKMTEILEIFSLLLNTDKFQKCQTDNKKSSKSFSDLLLSLAAPVAAGIQF